MKIEIEVSDVQLAAIEAVSKKVRLNNSETVRMLAVMAMNQQTDRQDFLSFSQEVLEAIEAGRWGTAQNTICGWIKPPAAALVPAKLLEAASNEPQIDAPLSVTLPPHLSAAIRFSACVNGQSPQDHIIDQMAEVEDDVASSWFGGETGAKEWLREKAEFEPVEVGAAS